MNGRKILVSGNHDSKHLKNSEFRSKWKLIKESYFEFETKINGEKNLIVCCHYPLQTFNGMGLGSYHLHGHCHTPPGETKIGFMKNRKDVGVDSRKDLSPWEKNDLINFINSSNFL